MKKSFFIMDQKTSKFSIYPAETYQDAARGYLSDYQNSFTETLYICEAGDVRTIRVLKTEPVLKEILNGQEEKAQKT